jgi:unsaturated rhamnogalacturonyl hydrolase
MTRRDFAALLAAPLATRPVWLSVAARLITTPADSYGFNWGEGVQMIGLLKTWERTKDDRYADWTEKWAGQFTNRDLAPLLNAVRPGYCGHWSPATAILLLSLARPKPAYRRLAEQVADYIRDKAERSPEGALGHWQGSHQLWVDTLYMACPLLAGLGQPAGVDDAARQIVLYAKHLQDERGLFFHMWDWQTGERSQGAWGRGNGWVMMSLADTLEAMDRGHAQWKPLQEIAGKLADGVNATQNADGLWHTVLDDRASYPEASATAMFVYGMLKLQRLGVLPHDAVPAAQRAWSALNARYVRDGLVTGVSGGTEPRGADHYKGRPQGTETWGTGAYLMAGSEMERLRVSTATTP